MEQSGSGRAARLTAVVAFLGALAAGCGGGDATRPVQAAPEPAGRPIALDGVALDADIEALLRDADPDVEVSLWLGPAAGTAWYERAADVWRASASAIKTAYLVELFQANAGRLDRPLEGAAGVVGDAAHPAVVHFDATTRAEIRDHLSAATVRDVGRMMIRGTDVSNAVYNAAANVTTAVLGGPEKLTHRIRARAPDFAGFAVRRYMLAARDVSGDNEVTAAALAAVLQRIARGDLPGVSAETLRAVREVLLLEEGARNGRHYQKGGSLDTDPMTRILSGYWEAEHEPIVYVVMVQRPGPGAHDRETAGQRLQALAQRLADAAVAAGRQAHAGS